MTKEGEAEVLYCLNCDFLCRGAMKPFCPDCNTRLEVGYESEVVFKRRTKMQHHSNYMLFMRRTMKGIASAMRVERWQLWMDSAPAAGELEPELHNEDLDAYLRAAGHTEESIANSLTRTLAIIQEMVEKDRDGEG